MPGEPVVAIQSAIHVCVQLHTCVRAASYSSAQFLNRGPTFFLPARLFFFCWRDFFLCGRDIYFAGATFFFLPARLYEVRSLPCPSGVGVY